MGSPTSTAAYTPEQAEVLRLHKLYRDCLLSQKYYAERLSTRKFWAFAMDLTMAIATSTALAGMAVMKTTIGANLFSLILSLSVIVSVIRPLLKLSESIDRYSKLHYAYAELALQIDSLVADMRRKNNFREEHSKMAADIWERYRNLTLQDDAAPNRKTLKKFQAEVNEAHPSTTLWLPN
jgi:hypothetical protein